MNSRHKALNYHAGFTLLEVVLAIAVFAFARSPPPSRRKSPRIYVDLPPSNSMMDLSAQVRIQRLIP